MILDIWRANQLIFLLLLISLLPFLFRPKAHPILILGALYSLISPLLIFQGLGSPYGGFQLRIDATTAKAFISNAMVIPLFFLTQTKRRTLIHLIHLIILLNSFWTLFHDYGIFGNHSMDGVATAIVLPSLFFIKSPYVSFDLLKRVIPSLSLLLSPGTTALICLVIALLFTFMKRTKAQYAIIGASAISLIGFLHIGHVELFNPGDRFQKWGLFMNWWWENANLWVGTGLGSFEWLGYAIQNEKKNVFLMMHNEYLQVLFEGGLIGFVLFITGFGMTFLHGKRIKQNWLTLTWIIAGITFLTQYPLRFMILQTFLVLMLAETWQSKEEDLV